MKASELTDRAAKIGTSPEELIRKQAQYTKIKWANLQDAMVDLVDELYEFEDPKNQPIAQAAIKAINTNQLAKAHSLIQQLG